MTRTTSSVVTGLALSALLSTGCATTSPEVEHAMPHATVPHDTSPRLLKMFNGHTGEPIAWSDLVESASTADVVIIGEQHGHPVGLPFAAALWEDVAAREDAAALSMEFFERQYQYALDAYLTGLIDANRFMKESDRTDSSYPPGHRQMVESAKAWGKPVYAANAPRIYSTAARKKGYDALREIDGEQARMFELPDKVLDGPYRDAFFEVMGSMLSSGHGGPPGKQEAGEQAEDEAGELIPEQLAEREAEEQKKKDELNEKIEGYFRAQLVWDATMSGTIVRALSEGHHPVVHVVGQFHVDHDGGTLRMVRARRPDATVYTVSVADAWSDELTEDDQDKADCVVYVGPAPER